MARRSEQQADERTCDDPTSAPATSPASDPTAALLADIAYAASVRFIEAMEAMQLSVTSATVVAPEGQDPGVRVGMVSTGDLDALSRLLEAEAARRAGVCGS